MFSIIKFIKKYNVSIFFFLVLSFLSIFFYLIYKYNNHYTYTKILSLNNSLSNKSLNGKLYFLGLNIFEFLVHEIDPVRIYNKNKYNKPKTLNIKMSSSDLSDLNSQIKMFKNKGFIKDELNYWRKAGLQFEKENYSINYKLHGTSISSLIDGNFNLRIKLKKDEKYLENIRQFNLIRIYKKSDENIPTIFLNNFANDFGLLSPLGETILLKINGVNIGFFYKQERHGEEWFERNEITNYSLLKTNDDWDKKNEIAHKSDFDLNERNIEVSGSSNNTDIALGSIKNLFDAIKANDSKKIFQLIDKEYFAKFLALSTFINDSHTITGDNLKYIYDFTNGKFKILFRQETGKIFPIKSKIENFNSSLFDSNESYKDSLSHELFKIILDDRDFRVKRDFYLHELLKQKNKIIQQVKSSYEQAYKIYIHTNMNLRHQKYLKTNFMNSIDWNFYKIEKYLNYAKIYASVEKKDEFSILSIVNDSFIPMKIKSIYFDREKEILNEDDRYLLPPITLKNNNLNYTDRRISLYSKKNITKIEIENTLTNEKVLQEHIYFNKIKKFKISNSKNLIKSLNENNISYEINKNNLNIKKGNYIVSTNIVVPKGVKINIDKGTNFILKKNISFLFRDDLYAKGTKNEKITIRNFDKDNPFGTFAIMGDENKTFVELSNFVIEGGSESIIEGVVFLGQLSIHNANVNILDSEINSSISDDGLNIRNSNIKISGTVFKNNKFDALDLDFCNGQILNSTFVSRGQILDLGGDGIDLSGSNIIISDNIINNFHDKGISVGEKSKVIVKKNHFEKNNVAVAIKDESKVYIFENNYKNNNLELSMYIKKNIFKEPNIYLNSNEYIKNNKFDKFKKKKSEYHNLDDGKINFIKVSEEEKFYHKFKNEITTPRI